MDSLPPLEELHAAYGFQVNELGVNELLGLFANRETGVIVSGFQSCRVISRSKASETS